MPQRVPARAGDPLDAIETPALVVDLAAFEANLDTMAAAVASSGLRLRPHAKSHKCPDIARAQLARGAVGICCQKTDEAIAFVEAGVRDVLLTNEVVHPAKLARLAVAARDARIGVLVDSREGAQAASDAAAAEGTGFDVYVEVDVGAGRCGVAPARGGAAGRGRRAASRRCASPASTAITAPRSTCARTPSGRRRSPPPASGCWRRSSPWSAPASRCRS